MTWEMTLQERYEDGVEAGRKAGLEEGVEIGRQEGIASGRREGRDQGIEEKLCSQIQKKLEKGKSLEQIADECEETEERILQLMEKLKISDCLKNR